MTIVKGRGTHRKLLVSIAELVDNFDDYTNELLFATNQDSENVQASSEKSFRQRFLRDHITCTISTNQIRQLARWDRQDGYRVQGPQLTDEREHLPPSNFVTIIYLHRDAQQLFHDELFV